MELRQIIKNHGGGARLCRDLAELGTNVSQQSVQGWISRNRVPLSAVWAFCTVTGLMPWLVRPDAFCRPSDYNRKIAELKRSVRPDSSGVTAR